MTCGCRVDITWHVTRAPVAADSEMGPDILRLCHTCRTVRPIRAKHCRSVSIRKYLDIYIELCNISVQDLWPVRGAVWSPLPLHLQLCWPQEQVSHCNSASLHLSPIYTSTGAGSWCSLSPWPSTAPSPSSSPATASRWRAGGSYTSSDLSRPSSSVASAGCSPDSRWFFYDLNIFAVTQ